MTSKPVISAAANLSEGLDSILAGSFVKQAEYRQQVDSTNNLALEIALRPLLATPLLVIAEEQTSGRGRGANRWWSGGGALTFSLILEPAAENLKLVHWPRLALIAGLSVCDMLRQLVPQPPCGLKWPNDVFLGSRKICGVLVEVPACRPPTPQRIVLGIGINVNNSMAEAPAEIAARATALCDVAHRPLDRLQVLLSVLRQLALNLVALAKDDPNVIARWQELCVLRGAHVEVEFGARRVRGICRGIDPHGALILETEVGPEQVFGGVVVAVDYPGRFACHE